MMKTYFLTSLSLLLSAFILTAKTSTTTIPASDTRIEYTGRILKCGDCVTYDWSGVYLRVKFTGTRLSIKCSDTKGDWFNYWIDKEMEPVEDGKVHICSKDTTIVLAKGLKKGTHEIILQKRTEAEQGRFTAISFECDGEFLLADGRKGRHIEFIGDSYTCGYGTESDNRDEPFKAETENCNLTYAAIASRYFGADYTLVSHSGQGISRNYDDYRSGYHMPDRYLNTFDEAQETENVKWDPSSVDTRPDIVVIYLCTNDFSTGRQPHFKSFLSNYKALLSRIKANYSEDIPVLCLASKANPDCATYIKRVCEECGLKNVYWTAMTEMVHNEDSELGASWHPNYKGHKKVASCVIPYISTITGWEMEEKPYR